MKICKNVQFNVQYSVYSFENYRELTADYYKLHLLGYPFYLISL